MKKDQKWQKPEVQAVKTRDSKKVLGASRKGAVRYSTGIGPTPPAPSDMA